MIWPRDATQKLRGLVVNFIIIYTPSPYTPLLCRSSEGYTLIFLIDIETIVPKAARLADSMGDYLAYAINTAALFG